MSALEQWLMGLLLEHNVLMLRAEAEIKAKVIALMIAMQKDIVSALAISAPMSELGKADKNTLLRESNALIAEYYGRAQLQLDLFGVAEVESLGVRAALSTIVEARIGVALPTENYLRTLVGDALIQGSPAKNWWLRQQQDTAFKLANEIRIGAAQGETNAQIIARVVGSDEVPGVMPMARKNAAAIVQTSMQTVAAEARRAVFQANRDISNGIMQVSTLDGHTSLVCIAYSGAQWDLDYEPMGGSDLPYNGGTPRHWNCRSVEVSLTKTYREMGIDMDEPAPGTRASSSGQISAKTTFAEYLTMMGEDYQNETLGPGRAELFRAGKLSPRDLVDMSGRPVRLADLKAKYSQ